MAKKASASKKKKTSKAASKKTAKVTAKKSSSKKTAAKTAAKKTKKAAAPAKKTTKKPAAKKTAAKKTAAKKATTKKPAVSKPTAKKTASKTAAKTSSKSTSKKVASASKPDAKPEAEKSKPQRKGITIVSKKPMKKPASKKASEIKMPSLGGGLLGPGAKRRKPLIASGPKAAPRDDGLPGENSSKKRKSPFNKRQLDKYREILQAKRALLFGDVSSFEEGALQSSSGGLSHTPQHIAEQGSDVQDQSLMLDLAAADRGIIKEIDAALARIADGTFGLCEMTGEPIGEDRLEELPWARFSIEAARMRERMGGGRP